jgi:hypothetical protein
MNNKKIYDNFLSVRNYIKDIIDKNITEIKSNNKEINEIIKIKLSSEKDRILNEKLRNNKDLLIENQKVLNLYNLLSNFIDKNIADVDMNNDIDYFQLTVDGIVDFDEKHPFFEDENFFNMLLEHFRNIEDYDYCDYLIKLKNNV